MGTRLAALMAGFLGTGRQTKPSSGSCKNSTMKTDKNSRTQSTTSGALSHPELAVPDTNSSVKYKVTLILAQRSSGSVLIEAASLEDARKQAEVISEVFNWEIFEDEISVESIELVSGGQSHE